MKNIRVAHENSTITRNASGQNILWFTSGLSPDICCWEWQGSRYGAATTCHEKQVQWFFMLNGILYSGLYNFFGAVLGLYYLRRALSHISDKAIWETLTCKCIVRACITLSWEKAAARELFPWALDALQTTVHCALFQGIWFIMVGSSVFAGWHQCWVSRGWPIYVYSPMSAKIISDVYD